MYPWFIHIIYTNKKIPIRKIPDIYNSVNKKLFKIDFYYIRNFAIWMEFEILIVSYPQIF